MVIAVPHGSRQVKKICRPSRDHSAKEQDKFGGLRSTRRLEWISKRKKACPGCVAASFRASLPPAAGFFEAAAAGAGSTSAETSSKSGLSGCMRTVLALD